MKSLNNRVISVGIVISLIIIAAWAGINAFSETEDRKMTFVSVIVEDSINSGWGAFQKGLEQASKDYNVELTYVTTGEFSSSSDEINLINKQIEDGANGIILSPQSMEDFDDLESIQASGIKMVLVESDVDKPDNSDDVLPAVYPDWTNLGVVLSEAIMSDFEGDLSGKRVQIITGNNTRMGYKNTVDALKKSLGADVEFLSEIKVAIDLQNPLFGIIKPDVVISIGDRALSAAARELAAEEGGHTKLYGIGCSESNIYYLERQIISCMVVPNNYKMGYVSMTQLVDSLSGFGQTNSKFDSHIDYRVIRSEDIHTEENERYLFLTVE